MFGTREKRATGIQFAGSVLRVVELVRNRAGTALGGAVEVRLEEPVEPLALGGEEQLEALAAALKRAVGEWGGSLARSCMGLNYRAFFLKCQPLIRPRAQGRRDCRANQEHLRWEIEQFLGGDLEGFNVDFALVGGRGFVVAARGAVLERYLELGGRAGIEDLEFDIEPFALYNAAEGAGLLDEGARALIVGLEPGGAHALLVEEGELEKAKHISRKAGEGGRLVDFVERCVRQVWGAEEVDEGLPPVWIAGAEAHRVGAALEKRLRSRCASFPSFTGIDTSAWPAAREAGSVFTVAVGLAYRRLSE